MHFYLVLRVHTLRRSSQRMYSQEAFQKLLSYVLLEAIWNIFGLLPRCGLKGRGTIRSKSDTTMYKAYDM